VLNSQICESFHLSEFNVRLNPAVGPPLAFWAPAFSTLKLALGGESDRLALPPVALRATVKIGGVLSVEGGVGFPMVENVSPPFCELMARNVYGLAATAAFFEYILYRLVGVAAPALLSLDLRERHTATLACIRAVYVCVCVCVCACTSRGLSNQNLHQTTYLEDRRNKFCDGSNNANRNT